MVRNNINYSFMNKKLNKNKSTKLPLKQLYHLKLNPPRKENYFFKTRLVNNQGFGIKLNNNYPYKKLSIKLNNLQFIINTRHDRLIYNMLRKFKVLSSLNFLFKFKNNFKIMNKLYVLRKKYNMYQKSVLVKQSTSYIKNFLLYKKFLYYLKKKFKKKYSFISSTQNFYIIYKLYKNFLLKNNTAVNYSN